MDKSKIRKYLQVIRRASDLIEDELENDMDDDDLEEFFTEPKKKKKPQVAETQPVVQSIVPSTAKRTSHVQELLANPDWPPAIDEYLQASPTTEDQINRANAILDMVVTRPLNGSNFLDFGCGDGWVAKQALAQGAISATGFDLLPSDCWKSSNGVRFTNVFRELKKNSYDIVLLFDVLDHCESPLEVMKQVRSLVSDNGVVYVKCHPWTSRHASHLYKQGLNKAYIHLYLSWEELVDLGYTPLFTRPEKNPIEAYHWWFKSGGFAVDREFFSESKVPEFFQQLKFKELLSAEQQLNANEFSIFFKAMSYEFVDYVLLPK